MSTFKLDDFVTAATRLDRAYAARQRLLRTVTRLTDAERAQQLENARRNWTEGRAKLHSDAQAVIRQAGELATKQTKAAHSKRVAGYEQSNDSEGYKRYLRTLGSSGVVALAKRITELSPWESSLLSQHGATIVKELASTPQPTTIAEASFVAAMTERQTPEERAAQDFALSVRMAAGFLPSVLAANPAEPRVNDLTADELDEAARAMQQEFVTAVNAELQTQQTAHRAWMGLPTG